MYNKVLLIGNLGRDPEVRSTPTGQQVANFSLATNRKWRDREGNRQEQTEWHYIVCWGRQAEIAGQYLTRGRQIFLEGRLQTSSWEDRQSGEKRYRTEVICDNFQMLGARPDGGGGGGGYGPQAYQAPAQDQGGQSQGGPGQGPGGGAPQGQGGGPPQGPSGDPGTAGDFGAEPEDDDIPF